MEKRVKIFVAELEAQRKEIFTLHSTIQKKSNRLTSQLDDEDLINSLAYKLHKISFLATIVKEEIDDFYKEQRRYLC